MINYNIAFLAHYITTDAEISSADGKKRQWRIGGDTR